MERITIIGLGLIGGSLGLALKAARLKDIEVVGYDKDTLASVDARRRGAVDKSEPILHRAVRDAGLVIIATPIMAIPAVMEEIAGELRENCVVTDTASTKTIVTDWARQLLPPTVSFVGGHPMAGKETAGIANAEATLFAAKPYCIVPAADASEGAVRAVAAIVQLIGARPFFIDAEEHDRYVAAVSHLPLILSTALFTLVRGSPAWPELSALASSGFRDVTRLASTDPALSHDICLTNRDSVLHWLDRLVEELSRYRELLQQEQEEPLFESFAKAQLERDNYLTAPPSRPERYPEVPSGSDQLLSLLVGERLVRRFKDIGKVLAERDEASLRQRRTGLGPGRKAPKRPHKP
ncbi:MAG: prephenate dehydrogenase/arogenate dehydrogenase family protein [Chloroflexota bacterium]|nr:prephenate dehydrogenase/arogenate dehydrogenase family protein [Chloroflexota bacterium]